MSQTNSRKYFGTDGIRGVASVPPLDSETMVKLGRAIAYIFMRKSGRHRILIGKDTRLSGYMIETALASGITSMGADVLLVGPLPTPGVAYLTKSMRADAGIMISASHNPYEDNGIKIFGADGFKLPDEKEAELELLLAPAALDGKQAAPSDIGKATRIGDAVGRYTVFLKGCFPREVGLDGLKIGLDCANGAAYIVAQQTMIELGAEVVARGISPNGRNINAGMGSLYPEVVRKLVREYSLDLGISLDGDGDRSILCDEKGNIIDGDMMLALCAKDLKQRGLLKRDEIVATVMSNIGLDRYLDRYGIKVRRSSVGDRYVLEEMLKNSCQLGGEQSGHVIFSDIATSGDGTLTALMILAIMVRQQKPLSELLSDFVKFPQKLINVPVARKLPLDSVDAIKQIISEKEKVMGSAGRVLVRYSGTESKLRVMVECQDEELCKKHAQDIAEVAQRELGAL